MAEYIDRDALLQGIEQVRRTSKNSFPRQHFVVGDVLKCIRTAPAAEVFEVRHGKWEEASDGDGIVCSECRTDFCTMIHETEKFNYCPNCGALMMEAEHEG